MFPLLHIAVPPTALYMRVYTAIFFALDARVTKFLKLLINGRSSEEKLHFMLRTALASDVGANCLKLILEL